LADDFDFAEKDDEDEIFQDAINLGSMIFHDSFLTANNDSLDSNSPVQDETQINANSALQQRTQMQVTFISAA